MKCALGRADPNFFAWYIQEVAILWSKMDLLKITVNENFFFWSSKKFAIFYSFSYAWMHKILKCTKNQQTMIYFITKPLQQTQKFPLLFFLFSIHKSQWLLPCRYVLLQQNTSAVNFMEKYRETLLTVTYRKDEGFVLHLVWNKELEGMN